MSGHEERERDERDKRYFSAVRKNAYLPRSGGMHMHEFVKGVKAKPPIFINRKISRKKLLFVRSKWVFLRSDQGAPEGRFSLYTLYKTPMCRHRASCTKV